ncbi:TetR/AcrR family transcriptional regulator [Arthrobacter crystallopoietes]|uniref:DNA-binding transcriptional regulator, AcrR family n=1 Tax=Crystallibacter crystallopoietes TaxID=37928 RepID=A0A1H1E157_9MICC|nr:TetR/AcrR family transcriptional regulator [Arthrobacter crystallopoietes]AUI50083.1 TetR family transcriptional regulator [Arthrobacter crystallopoietes]SDQ82491.1 DNA-binding transcriptional regulator, AcrR family [Arthrobacter crystallopoietes]
MVKTMDNGSTVEQAQFRSGVASIALELFVSQGYEATSVDAIAEAAGISRSKFFRQFRSKEDVIFADHETLLEHAEVLLARKHEDPWEAVCRAAAMVFEHFAKQVETARQRYQVVNAVPALRDRELVTVFRYERLFGQYLRDAVPGLPPLDAVRFAATVISTHNFLLRELMRNERQLDVGELRAALDDVRRLYGVLPSADAGPRAEEEMVVAVFPKSLPPAELARRLQQKLQRG